MSEFKDKEEFIDNIDDISAVVQSAVNDNDRDVEVFEIPGVFERIHTDEEIERFREEANTLALLPGTFKRAGLMYALDQYESMGNDDGEYIYGLFKTGRTSDVGGRMDKMAEQAQKSGDMESYKKIKQIKMDFLSDRLSHVEQLNKLDKATLNFSYMKTISLKMNTKEIDDLTNKVLQAALASGLYHGKEEDLEEFKRNIRANLNHLNRNGMHSILRRTAKELSSEKGMQSAQNELKLVEADKKENYSDLLVQRRQLFEDTEKEIEEKIKQHEQELSTNEPKPETASENENIKVEEEKKQGIKAVTVDMELAVATANSIGFYSFNKAKFETYYKEHEPLQDTESLVRAWQQNAYNFVKDGKQIGEHVYRKADFDKAIENMKNGQSVDMSGFYPQTAEQVKAFCKTNNLNLVNPEQFFNEKKKQNWKDSSGAYIKSWKAMLRNANERMKQQQKM